MKFPVFVYGTLKSGQHNHGIIVDQQLLGPAYTQGRLYIRGLPFFKQANDGVVRGELYLVDQWTLARLDRLEGYNESNPELSHYKRITVHVGYQDRDGRHEEEDAFIYEYNYPIDEQYLNKEGIYRG